MPRLRLLGAALLIGAIAHCGGASAAGAPFPIVERNGPATVLFDPARDGCDSNDVPDAPARLFRNADNDIVLFGLHYTNHFLKGRSLDALKIVCRPALLSNGNADPAAYDDKSWIAATWTRDGTIVNGLVHHEYQANGHPGRCRFPDYMQCWFNTVLAVRSTDGGATFAKISKPVVASAPFQQEWDQGRHRGFFNPSNIFSDGRFFYVLASTTGWPGQSAGVCLFRTRDPDDGTSWRAFDGAEFTVRYANPYVTGASSPKPCLPVGPFPAPVGNVVRQRGTGLWLAVFQAARAGSFPVSGIYVAASRNLLDWSAPRLLIQGTTNYENPCDAKGEVIAYPSLIDPDATGRNFDDVGPRALLLYTREKVDGCRITSDRVLIRQPVLVQIEPG